MARGYPTVYTYEELISYSRQNVDADQQHSCTLDFGMGDAKELS